MEFIKDIPIEKKTKAKLEACVQSYSELFPDEYAVVVDHIKKKRWLLDDMKFGQAKTDGVITRALFEIPEGLHTIINQYLTVEELEQFKGQKGSRWFATRFSQFRNAHEV